MKEKTRIERTQKMLMKRDVYSKENPIKKNLKKVGKND